MKKNAGMVLSAAVVLTLAVLSVVFSDYGLTAGQRETIRILLIVCGASAIYCFVTGELAKNYSQMDKLWSILPVAYVWITAAKSGMKPRLIVYALIVTAWGIRLTINFARKGAYSLKFWTGKEDYRWAVVHRHPIFRHKALWTLFDLFFISMYQNALVLAICLPAVACMESEKAFGAFDVIACVSAAAFLALETVADEQQWRFHETKRKLLEEKKTLNELPYPYSLGFNTIGLWGRMRHPNYLGEQAIWLCLYLFVIGVGAAGHGLFHWTLLGPLFLVLLFMGSSTLGEAISASKYPHYKDYQKQVRKYLPVHRYDPDKTAEA